MTRDRVKWMALALSVVLAPSAGAQVGHVPARSPYVDLDFSQEMTFYAGHSRTRHDPAGVAPLSFPVAGLRYEATVAGPLALGFDIYGGRGSRNKIDPLRPAATRLLGTQSVTELGLDLAGTLNLTGTRSWHSLVPQVRAGLGFVRNSAADDSSGFAVGTPFAISWGGGVKYVRPGNRLQVRADFTDRMFKLNYPDAYYRLATDNTSVLTGTTPRSFYTHHSLFTIGFSYLFAR